MYRIGDVQFSTYEEADDWAHGNVGGTYRIEPLAFCRTCGDWQDEGDRCDVCGAAKVGDEFDHGNKTLARLGIRYWKMQPTHPMWPLRCWVFGFPIR
jgi:hypothetical protein